MKNNQIKLPKGWTENSLGNILKYEQPYNYTVDSTEYNDRSGIPVLTAGKSFVLGYTTELHNVYKNTPVIIFDDFTTDSKFVDFPFKVKSSAMKFLKPKCPTELEIQLIFEHLQNLKIRETGGDHKRRWISEFSKLKVALPPFAEQTKISSIIHKVDEAISKTEQLIVKYTRIKTGLMQDLLTKGIDEQGNIRSEERHEFKTERGFVYPAEWCLTTIDKCTNGIEQGWSPSCDSDPAPINQWGILKTTAVSWDGFYEMENKQMPKYLTPKAQYEVKKGDVLITRAGPNSRVGVVAFVNETRQKLIFSDKIYRLSPKENVINRYLALALSSQFTQRHLSNFKTGMAESQTNISQKIILALNILIPSPEEQKRIVQKIEKAEEFLKVLKLQLSKIQSLKTGLMQDLLSGTVRVNHLIKETESL